MVAFGVSSTLDIVYRESIMIDTEIIFGHAPFLKECRNHSEMIKATSIPINGASTMKEIILIMVGPSIAPNPVAPLLDNKACAMAAPPKPPIRVCEELEGIPNHQVIRFQAMAAMRPARITARVMYSVFTVLAMVLATPWSKIKYAAKLKNAAHTTACKGVNTFVDTTVAIAFAASWKPLI
jgi:hypothetical protein